MNLHGMPSQRWDQAHEAEAVKWQPLMLITPERLECPCGALAIFLYVAVDADGDICDGQAYCQPCLAKAQEEED